MNESSFKLWFLKNLRNNLSIRKISHSIICIESPIIRGIPDVNYNINCSPGWIEFKYLDKWPKTSVKLPHYTVHQYNFLIERGKLEENTNLITRIGNDIIISSYPYIPMPDAYLSKENFALNINRFDILNIDWDIIINTLGI